MTWSVEGCTAAVAVVPVPADALPLPDGFRALTLAEAGLPEDPRGDAVFALESFDCARGTAGNETLEDVPHGGVFTFVEPPETLRDDDVDFFYFYRWDTLIAAPTLRAFLADAGAPVYDGATSLMTATMPEAGGPLLASMDLNGTRFEFQGAAQPVSGGTGGTFKEFLSTPNGLATWKTTGAAPFGQGAGSVQVNGGFAEEVLGNQRVPGYVLFLADVSFVDGVATVP